MMVSDGCHEFAPSVAIALEDAQHRCGWRRTLDVDLSRPTTSPPAIDPLWSTLVP
jgi:hypothetical protein